MFWIHVRVATATLRHSNHGDLGSTLTRHALYCDRLLALEDSAASDDCIRGVGGLSAQPTVQPCWTSR